MPDTADAWAKQIGQTGRVPIYGINFDIRQSNHPAGLGSTSPLAGNTSEERRQKNRRVDLIRPY